VGPTKPKAKVPAVPDFIDDAVIAKLPKEKQEYWKNRKAGNRGQGIKAKLMKVFKTPKDIVMGFDNNGAMVAKTRAVRRKKKPTNNVHTKVLAVTKRKKK
jgi:hypothetical protein